MIHRCSADQARWCLDAGTRPLTTACKARRSAVAHETSEARRKPVSGGQPLHGSLAPISSRIARAADPAKIEHGRGLDRIQGMILSRATITRPIEPQYRVIGALA